MSGPDRVTLPDDVAEALDRLPDASARHVVDRSVTTWWRAQDPRGAEVLERLARSGADDPHALDALLAALAANGVARPAIRRYLLDDHDVADAEQATLAVVGLRLGDWERRSRFTSWLHQVAANEAKMLIRARDRRPSTPVADPQPRPFTARLSSVLADRDLVDRAIRSLPDELREPLVLRELDGLEYVEIASALGIELGTVRSRLHRARAALVVELRSALDTG